MKKPKKPLTCAECGTAIPPGEEKRCANILCEKKEAFCGECAERLLDEDGLCAICIEDEEKFCDGCGETSLASKTNKCRRGEHLYCEECIDGGHLYRGHCEGCEEERDAA